MLKNFKMLKKINVILITIAFLLLPAINAMGQPPPPPPQQIPIDGGLIVLLFSGVAYFVNKVRKK